MQNIIELSDFSDDEFTIKVGCSKGTYIRSLIADMGEALGCGATMTALRRTLSNGFTIENAKTEGELEALGESAVMGIDAPCTCFPEVKITENQARRFSNGGELSADRLHREIYPSLYRVYGPDGTFLGLGEVREDDKTTLWAKRVVGNDK